MAISPMSVPALLSQGPGAQCLPACLSCRAPTFPEQLLLFSNQPLHPSDLLLLLLLPGSGQTRRGHFYGGCNCSYASHHCFNQMQTGMGVEHGGGQPSQEEKSQADGGQ